MSKSFVPPQSGGRIIMLNDLLLPVRRDLTKSDLIELLGRELSNEGIRSRVVPISRWEEVRQEVSRTVDEMSDEGLKRYIDACFDLEIERSMKNPKSIIVMGLQSPKVRFVFQTAEEDMVAFVPPTYLDFFSAKGRIEPILQDTLGEYDHGYAYLRIPAKLLAVRSGLAEYGRNNVSYVEGWGSHVRLMIYATDLPYDDHDWYNKREMSICSRCDRCHRNCPTGAIDGSRFLLRAERCLTFLNEAEEPMPQWVDPSWHNCLIGCLRCQDICPANKEVANSFVDGRTFTEEETATLVETPLLENLPMELRRKVEGSGLSYLYPVLPRNLDLLLSKQDSTACSDCPDAGSRA